MRRVSDLFETIEESALELYRQRDSFQLFHIFLRRPLPRTCRSLGEKRNAHRVPVVGGSPAGAGRRSSTSASRTRPAGSPPRSPSRSAARPRSQTRSERSTWTDPRATKRAARGCGRRPGRLRPRSARHRRAHSRLPRLPLARYLTSVAPRPQMLWNLFGCLSRASKAQRPTTGRRDFCQSLPVPSSSESAGQLVCLWLCHDGECSGEPRKAVLGLFFLKTRDRTRIG